MRLDDCVDGTAREREGEQMSEPENLRRDDTPKNGLRGRHYLPFLGFWFFCAECGGGGRLLKRLGLVREVQHMTPVEFGYYLGKQRAAQAVIGSVLWSSIVSPIVWPTVIRGVTYFLAK